MRRQCDLLGVNRSSLYYEAVGESEENRRVMRLMDEEYTRHPFFGSRRMKLWLSEQGHEVNRKRVRRLMERMEIEAVYPKPKVSEAGEGHKIYPYLLKGVEVTRVNQVWSTDITYIRMTDGFVYLVAVMDWYSRYVLSWSVSVTMEMDFRIEEAVAEAGATGDLQQRPGFTVHEREVHGGVGEARHQDQHGWAWAVFRQHLHRTVVAVAEVRGDLLEELRPGAGGA